MGELQPQQRIDEMRAEIVSHATDHTTNVLRFLDDYQVYLNVALGTSQLAAGADGAAQREAFGLHLGCLGYARTTINERVKVLEELRANLGNLDELRRSINHRRFLNGLSRWTLAGRAETIKVICPTQVTVTGPFDATPLSRREQLLHSFWIAVILTGCRPDNFIEAKDSRRTTEALSVTWGLRKGGRHGGTYNYLYAWSHLTPDEVPLTMKLNGLPATLRSAGLEVKDLNNYLTRHGLPTSGVARARLSTVLRSAVVNGKLSAASFELLLDHELTVSGQYYDAVEVSSPVRKVRMAVDKVHRTEQP